MKNPIQIDDATRAEILAFAEELQKKEMAHGIQVENDLRCLYRLAVGDDQEGRFKPSSEVRLKIRAWKFKSGTIHP